MKLLITEPDRPGSPADQLRIELNDEGTSGFSFAAPALRPMLEQLMGDCLAGEDPRAISALYDRMTTVETRAGGDSRASAALDVALWRLNAQLRKEPLWRALGGGPPIAEHYATVPADCEEGLALAGWCRRMRDQHGIRAIKVSAAADVQIDAARLSCITNTFAESDQPVTLMLDFAGAHAVKVVERRVVSLERQFELAWVEAPARAGDFLGYARVSRAVGASVCAPPGLNSASDYLAYFHAHAVDVVQLDLTTMGLTGALRVADAAYGFELPVTIAAYPDNLGLQLSGALPYFLNAEFHDGDIGAGSGTRSVS